MKVRVSNILISKEREPFSSPIRMQLFLECSDPPAEDLEFKIIYVGCAESSDYDQVLDDLLIPVRHTGGMSFDLVVEAPDFRKVPTITDLLGVSVIMVSAFYRQQEFFRCSYFIYNNYVEEVPEEFNEQNFDIKKVFRSILTDKPRIVLTDIDWNDQLAKMYEEVIKIKESEDLKGLNNANQELFSRFANPFQLNENSFLKSNLGQGHN